MILNRYALCADRLWDGLAPASESGRAVLVEGDRIGALLPLAELPDDVPVLAFPGCTLLPGLIDAHVHYGEMMGPLFLAAGVTTVRDTGGSVPYLVAQRAHNAAHPNAGPRLVCCGRALDGPKGFWRHIARTHADIDAMRAALRTDLAAGIDAIKLYASLDLEWFQGGVEEARKAGVPVVTHLGPVSGEEAIRAGADDLQHLAGIGPAWRASTREEQDAFIDLLLEHDTAVTPTLIVWDRLGRVNHLSFNYDSRRRWLHPCYLDIWRRYLTREGPAEGRLRWQEALPHLTRFVVRLLERRAIVALGTDTPFPNIVPGFAVHDELALYVDGGIEPVDALRSATSLAARALRLQDQVGQLAPGLAADLLVVAGNPLEEIACIAEVRQVIHAGRLLQISDLFAAARAYHDRLPSDAITQDLLAYVNGEAMTGSAE